MRAEVLLSAVSTVAVGHVIRTSGTARCPNVVLPYCLEPMWELSFLFVNYS